MHPQSPERGLGSGGPSPDAEDGGARVPEWEPAVGSPRSRVDTTAPAEPLVDWTEDHCL